MSETQRKWQLRDPHGERTVHRHELASRHHLSIEQQVDRLLHLPLQDEHFACARAQEFADAHLRLAHADVEPHANAVQGSD